MCLAVKGYFAQVGTRGSGASACGNTEGGKPRLPDIPELNYQPEQMVENAIKAGMGMAERKLVYAWRKELRLPEKTLMNGDAHSIPWGLLGWATCLSGG